MDRNVRHDDEPTMEDAPVTPVAPLTPTPAPKRRGFGRRWLVGVGAVAMLVALAAMVVPASFAAQAQRGADSGNGPGFGQGFAQFQRRIGNNGGNAGNAGGFGDRGGFGGVQAVIGNVDAGANTITLTGVPQQVATVRVDSNVQLFIANPDGTVRPAAIGDFRNGAVVRVGIGRAAASAPAAGAATAAPGQGNRGNFAVVVNRLTLVPDNLASVSGLVTANANGVLTVVTRENQRVTVRTQGNTTYLKNRNVVAAASDVVVGSRISVRGTQAADGVTAASVHIFDLSTIGQGGNFPGIGGGTGMMPGGPGRAPGAAPAPAGTPAATPRA